MVKNNDIERILLMGIGRSGLDNEASIIAKALSELMDYRAIGTVEELQSMKDNGAFTGVELAQLAAMQMKLKDYEAIGTVQGYEDAIKSSIDNYNLMREYKAKVQEFEAIGTVEEVRYYKRMLHLADMVAARGEKEEIEIRNQAIDEFAHRIRSKVMAEIDDCADELDWIDEIAEQMKAGGEDE